jgi:hypothetical protein
LGEIGIVRRREDHSSAPVMMPNSASCLPTRAQKPKA